MEFFNFDRTLSTPPLLEAIFLWKKTMLPKFENIYIYYLLLTKKNQLPRIQCTLQCTTTPSLSRISLTKTKVYDTSVTSHSSHSVQEAHTCHTEIQFHRVGLYQTQHNIQQNSFRIDFISIEYSTCIKNWLDKYLNIKCICIYMHNSQILLSSF